LIVGVQIEFVDGPKKHPIGLQGDSLVDTSASFDKKYFNEHSSKLALWNEEGLMFAFHVTHGTRL